MSEDRFLTDAYRRFLDELRRIERRIVAAAQPSAEVESPDPREVHGRLDRLLDDIQGDAVAKHRDVSAQSFRVAMAVMAATADTLLGRLSGWDGAARFRDPSPDRLAVGHPVPDGLPENLVDQILAQLGAASAEAGDVVESDGEQQIRSGKMDPDLARLYLLRLWVVVPDDVDERGDRSLASLRARLSAQLPVVDTHDDDDRELFPDAYRRKAAPQTEALLPAVRPWIAAVWVVAILGLVLGALVWLDTTNQVRAVAREILAKPQSSAVATGTPTTDPATDPGDTRAR